MSSVISIWKEFTICGHVGIAGALETRDDKFMKRLLIQDYFRGPDSTGFAAMANNNEVKVSKIASHPIDLFQMKSFDTILSGFKSKVFLGHNRFATKGKVTSFNAHPYQFGDITCAHNGTLDKSSWDALEKELGENFEVDSMAIVAHMAKFGIENTVKLLQGAWALVWIDSSDNTLNFLRNDQRPFWIAYSDDLKKVIWASEHPMIKAAIELGDPLMKQKLWTTKKDGFGYFSTDVNVLYKIDLSVLIGGKLNKDAQPDFRVRDAEGNIVIYKGKEQTKSVTTSYGTTVDPFTGEAVTNTSGTTPLIGSRSPTASGQTSGATQQLTAGSASTTSTTSSLGNSRDNVIHLRGTEYNPLAGYIDGDKFKSYAKYGCAWCQADVEYGDVGIKVFPESEQVMCADCSSIGGHNRVYLQPNDFKAVGEK